MEKISFTGQPAGNDNVAPILNQPEAGEVVATKEAERFDHEQQTVA